MYKSDLKNKITLVGSGFQRNKARIPVSVLLYLFVSEILVLKLKVDTLIYEANLNMTSEMTYLHHADALILTTESIQSLERASIYPEFLHDHAGSNEK